ncbi:MAG: DUF6273 domain-containing protein [Phascolarctobacterium sp.]|nr:DUF6273 domain-containing protein [Phascolarctobacterium sp.]
MIKFNLYSDGKVIRNLEELSDNFNIDDIYDYYQNGKLVDWLRMRNYEREYIQVDRIKGKDKKSVCDKLCLIFGVAEAGAAVAESIAHNECTVSDSEFDARLSKLEKAVKDIIEEIDSLKKMRASLAPKSGTVNQSSSPKVFPYVTTRPKLNLKIGDCLEFGSYYRTTGKNWKQIIRWLVLAIEGNKALIISVDGLDAKPLNDSIYYKGWSSCQLRNWLNGEFKREAFSEQERERIIDTKIDGGIDAIFILNDEEFGKYLLGINSRKCKATGYAKERGAKIDNGYCCWWLRTLGNASWSAKYVKTNGVIDASGEYVNIASKAVRPAMWIKI